MDYVQNPSVNRIGPRKAHLQINLYLGQVHEKEMKIEVTRIVFMKLIKNPSLKYYDLHVR